MKKFFLSFFLIITFAFYVVLSRGPDSQTLSIPDTGVGKSIPRPSVSDNVPAVSPNVPPTGTGSVKSTPKTSPSISGNIPPTVPTPLPMQSPPVNSGLYKDGGYVGSVADAYYGNVQVKAVITAGKITNVQFLDYPHDRSTSREINMQAMPYLIQEAIQTQSAQVDVVSGATETSGAFVESLSSALAQARI